MISFGSRPAITGIAARSTACVMAGGRIRWRDTRRRRVALDRQRGIFGGDHGRGDGHQPQHDGVPHQPTSIRRSAVTTLPSSSCQAKVKTPLRSHGKRTPDRDWRRCGFKTRLEHGFALEGADEAIDDAAGDRVPRLSLRRPDCIRG